MTWGCLEKTEIGRVGLASNPLVQVAHCSVSNTNITRLLRKFEHRAPMRQKSLFLMQQSLKEDPCLIWKIFRLLSEYTVM